MDPRERVEETVKWVKKERKEAKVIQDQGRATKLGFFVLFISFNNFQSVLALVVPEAKRRKLYMTKGVIDLIQIILNH